MFCVPVFLVVTKSIRNVSPNPLMATNRKHQQRCSSLCQTAWPGVRGAFLGICVKVFISWRLRFTLTAFSSDSNRLKTSGSKKVNNMSKLCRHIWRRKTSSDASGVAGLQRRVCVFVCVSVVGAKCPCVLMQITQRKAQECF